MSMLTLAETKSCCYLAYDANSGQRYKFQGGAIWEVIDAWATMFTGFKAILIRPAATPGRAVLAYAGTDSVRDVLADGAQVVGVLPIQYPQALGLANRCSRLYPSLQLCGHSLGGGLAAYASVRTGLPASTVNPAPLVAGASLSAGCGSHPQSVNYIAGGSEVVSSSPGRNPGTQVNVPGSGNFFTRHSLANTAPGIALPTPA